MYALNGYLDTKKKRFIKKSIIYGAKKQLSISTFKFEKIIICISFSKKDKVYIIFR